MMMFKKQDERVYEARRAKLGLGKKKTMKIGTRNSKPKNGLTPLESIPGLYIQWWESEEDQNGYVVDANGNLLARCPKCGKVSILNKGRCSFCRGTDCHATNVAVPTIRWELDDFDPKDERSWGKIREVSADESKFRSYELYCIEEDGGEKVIHIICYVWKNDGRDEGDYTVTDYTWCIIPLKDFVGKQPDVVWDLISDAEESVKQYEGDYTWEELVEEGYATLDGSRYLPLDQITMDTPCGDYYYYV